MTDPVGIDSGVPRFTWRVESDAPSARSVVQDGYVLTLEQEEVRAPQEGASRFTTLLSTGLVAGNTSSFAAHPWLLSTPLQSDTSYRWSVRLSDNPTAKIATATFSTGLLQQEDWSAAEWLEASNASQLASQMRKDFTVPADAESWRATLFVCVPGYGTVSVNGQRVDGGAGIRSWAQYDVRALYSTYDVTHLLQPGNNTLGVYTGRGWYSHFGYGAPTARVVLRISTTGAAPLTTTVVSDGSWLESPGPISDNDEYNGEVYDARLETPGWDTPDFHPDSSWLPVKVTTKTNKLQSTTMSAASFPAVLPIATLEPKTINSPSPGVWVLDFEQNLSGWIRLMLTGAAGTRVQFRHAEALMHPPYGPADGNIYVGNLRGAKATDVYILKGDPEGEVFEPLFTQHGFRYVEVTGLDAPPTSRTVQAVHVRSAVADAGSVAFSDELMNKVQHNLYWGQSTNLMMIPTDCDQRDERLGWTGDSALTAEEAMSNFDMGAFYHNWVQMLEDTSPNGAIGCTVPGRPGAANLPAGNSCDASWTSVFPTVLHGLLKNYADESIDTHWTALTRFMDNEYSRVTTKGGGIDHMFANFGDWVPPPPAKKVDAQFTAGFSFLFDVRSTIDMATKLNKTADVSKYTAVWEHSSELYKAKWFDAKSNTWADGGQTAHVLALELALGSDVEQAAVLQHLVNDIVEVHGNHTTCGIIGWRFQPEVLSKYGYADVAYALMTQRTYPSYGFEIYHPTEPATTIWELWDGPSEGPGMNSRDHIMFGGPGNWLYTYVGGITQTDASMGYQHVVFTPPATLIAQAIAAPTKVANDTTSDPLRWTSASKRVPLGEFTLSWALEKRADSTCNANAGEGTSVVLSCPSGPIASVVFASYGTPSGDCGALKTSSCNADLTAYVKEQCVGKDTCTISCDQGSCGSQKTGDPCFGTTKHLAVEVACGTAGKSVRHLKVGASLPANTVADTVLPTLSQAGVNVTEGGVLIWSDNQYHAGATGITGAAVSGNTIVVNHGSGTYDFDVAILM